MFAGANLDRFTFFLEGLDLLHLKGANPPVNASIRGF